MATELPNPPDHLIRRPGLFEIIFTAGKKASGKQLRRSEAYQDATAGLKAMDRLCSRKDRIEQQGSREQYRVGIKSSWKGCRGGDRDQGIFFAVVPQPLDQQRILAYQNNGDGGLANFPVLRFCLSCLPAGPSWPSDPPEACRRKNLKPRGPGTASQENPRCPMLRSPA